LKATKCIKAINQEYEYVAEVITLFDGMSGILRDRLQQSPFKTSSNGIQ
jgi:hypothetical protein